MYSEERKASWKNRKYKILPYDSSWSEQYYREVKEIRTMLGDMPMKDYHIGSTSVPGLAGKETIDILFVLQDISLVDLVEDKMITLGYTPKGNIIATQARLFEKNRGDERTFIVHFFEADDPEVKKMLIIREYLRTHRKEIKAYSSLKVHLMQSYPEEYQKYRKEKDLYMKDLQTRATEWYQQNKDKISQLS